MIKIKDIKIDGGTQTRIKLDYNTIENYSQLMLEEKEFPPVIIFYDGENYWLADGFHRLKASVLSGFTEIEAEIKQGTRRDAVLYSVGANSDHGLPRSNQDKRNAVMTLLNDEEWKKWSDREISKKCSVSQNFVSSVRRSLKSDLSEKPTERTYTTKHGTTATMNTEKIGKQSENIKSENLIDIDENLDNEIKNEFNLKNEKEVTERQFEENENEVKIDYVVELVSEMYDTINRRFSKLSKNEKLKANNLLITKLKEV